VHIGIVVGGDGFKLIGVAISLLATPCSSADLLQQHFQQIHDRAEAARQNAPRIAGGIGRSARHSRAPRLRVCLLPCLLSAKPVDKPRMRDDHARCRRMMRDFISASSRTIGCAAPLMRCASVSRQAASSRSTAR